MLVQLLSPLWHKLTCAVCSYWYLGFVLCCAVLCCAVLCCAVLCCAVLCCAVLCCAAVDLLQLLKEKTEGRLLVEALVPDFQVGLLIQQPTPLHSSP